MSTELDFQLKLLVYQIQLELSFFQNVAKTTKRSFSLLYSICHLVQGHLHLDKSNPVRKVKLCLEQEA